MTDHDYEQIYENFKEILVITADKNFPEKEQIFELMEKIRERQMKLFCPGYKFHQEQTAFIINKLLFS